MKRTTLIAIPIIVLCVVAFTARTETKDTGPFPLVDLSEIFPEIELGEGFEVTLCYEVAPPIPYGAQGHSIEVEGDRVWYNPQTTVYSPTAPIHIGVGKMVVPSSSRGDPDFAWDEDDYVEKLLLISSQREPRVIARVFHTAPDMSVPFANMSLPLLYPIDFVDEHLVFEFYKEHYEDNTYTYTCYVMYLTGDWDGGTGVGGWGEM